MEQAGQPNTQDGPKRKRRRKIWSCTECRRRKLQCDRALPACTRCTTAGQASQCSYVDDVPTAESPDYVLNGRFKSAVSPIANVNTHARNPHPSSQSDLRVNQHLSNQSTASLRATTSKPLLPPTPESVIDAGSHRNVSTKIEEMIHLDGSSFRTKFNGNTHASSSVNLISGLSTFSKDIRDGFPAVDAVRQEIHLSQVQKILSKPSLPTESDLRNCLPPRAKSDRLVQLYLGSYGNIYDILHLPDFRKDYDELWSNYHDTKPQFLILLLLIIAAALCLDAMDSDTPSSPSARDEATTIIHTCEAWLNSRIRKPSTMTDFQTAFLMLLARQLNGRRFKATWANGGKVIRDFISAGLNRDPENMKDTAVHEKDIRRRLWLSIAEFELQAAFEQGMPAMPWPQQSDITPAKGLADVAEQEFSSSSYLLLASDSLLFRHELNSLLNNFYKPLSFDESKLLTERIESFLEDTPSWRSPEAAPPQALLSLNLLQYILALHERQVREATTLFEKNTSRSILLTTAMKMIDLHNSVRDSGSHVIDLFYEDHIRAALSLCYVYSTLDPGADYLLTKAAVPHAMDSMEAVITMLSEKALRYEYDHRQLWIVIVAKAFMQLKTEPDRRQQLMQQAADDFTGLLHKVFEIHKTVTNGNRSRNEVPEPKGIAGVDGVGAQSGAVVEQHDPTLPVLEGVDDWALEGWMFEDWPFEAESLGGWTANAGPMVLS